MSILGIKVTDGNNFTIGQFHHQAHKRHEVRGLKDLFIKRCALCALCGEKGSQNK
jgi:hypothetical protein